MKKEKICVYTCITGDYDNIHEIKNKEAGIDYFCYTNNKNLKSKTWKIIYINDDTLTNIQLARRTKLLGAKEIKNYDIQVWIDGAVSFNKSIKQFIHKYLKDGYSFAGFKHGVRDNIKEECFACIRVGKETKENVQRLLKFYENENYKFDNGLIESTVFIRKPKDKIVQKTMALWFDMLLKYSNRDQLSFNYCLKKTNLKVCWIDDIKVFDNEWFNWFNHKYENTISKYRLYFGEEKNYLYDNDVYGDYEVDENTYKIVTTIPDNVDKITLDITHYPCTYLKSIKIDGKEVDDITYFNHMIYDGKILFYTEYPIVEIRGNFIKDDPLTIELEIEKLDLPDLYKLISDLRKDNINEELKNRDIITGLVNENEKLSDNLNDITYKLNDTTNKLNEITNSKSWKILNNVRKIIRR